MTIELFKNKCLDKGYKVLTEESPSGDYSVVFLKNGIILVTGSIDTHVSLLYNIHLVEDFNRCIACVKTVEEILDE